MTFSNRTVHDDLTLVLDRAVPLDEDAQDAMQRLREAMDRGALRIEITPHGVV
ncbi:hypothetical protein OG563_26800 [Nocardia vinacea]|uniref:Uncharacterized protein n=1 Tax=Nocardia vinacea TaxID=96468 RepID=A0ABZ1YIQ8_9NOCA|nr:hypothetical protein [Nocardia vinacea]